MTGPEAASFGEDIQMAMYVLRTVKSLEISEFGRDLCSCRNVEEKQNVLDKRHHLMVKLVHINVYTQVMLSYERTGLTLRKGYRSHKRSLHCCPIIIPTLINIEAMGCRLAMTGHGILVIVSIYLPSPKKLLRRDLRALLALGNAVILFGDFNYKSPTINYNGDKLHQIEDRLDFEIIALSTYYRGIATNRPSTLDIALTKRVTLNLNCIKTLHCLLSDHRPVLLKMRLSDGGSPNPTLKITDWKRVSNILEKIDTPSFNSIPDDIGTTDEIDSAKGFLTNHVRSVVENSGWEVPASSDRRKLPTDVLELIRAKNTALRRASAYSTAEHRSRARVLQSRVRLKNLHSFASRGPLMSRVDGSAPEGSRIIQKNQPLYNLA
ncbi:RNA-directed DNA polymerase from mobile element jockey [Eumeta japonica]|uniref:RNA-directed DNA polymerase from mobile element jockey n=1 Tax=Eumeta variegata TaxID=151549 RepID=A0A4C1T5D0_EUMVA|nr:RNA-directed DNA polymerase from mobile element jockey [Eumeta japonica]